MIALILPPLPPMTSLQLVLRQEHVYALSQGSYVNTNATLRPKDLSNNSSLHHNNKPQRYNNSNRGKRLMEASCQMLVLWQQLETSMNAWSRFSSW